MGVAESLERKMETDFDTCALSNGLCGRSGEYALYRLMLDADGRKVPEEWRRFAAETNCNPMHDPDWLTVHFAGKGEPVFVYLLYRSGSLCGVAPFAFNNWPLKWHIGEMTVAELPLRRLRVVGGAPRFPDDKEAWDLLFRYLAQSGFNADAIYFDAVPIESFLWRYMTESRSLRRLFRKYVPQTPAQHYFLRLNGCFEEYMKGFSSKHRKNLNREVRKLKDGEAGEMRFIRYTRAEDLPEFIDFAVAVAQKTWQWNLLHSGVANPASHRRLRIEAEHGWLRSYVMVCGETPVAFIVGFQYGGVFLFHEVGFDSAYAKFSVGTVLFLLTIEDLFNYQKATVMDLGSHGTYKDSFTKESSLEGSVFLFRRGSYTAAIQMGHRFFQAGSNFGSSMLDKFGLKERIRKKIRGASVRH